MAKRFVLAGIAGLAVLASSPSQAQDASPVSCLQTFSCQLYGPCHLPCLSSEDRPDAGIQAQADPGQQAEGRSVSSAPLDASLLPRSRAVASDRAVRPRKAAAAKRVLTIAAEETAMGSLKALASLVPDQPVRLLAAPPHATVASTASDFLVTADVGTAASRPGSATKLFSEQVHVIAGPGITRIQDLAGRVVSFGPDGSAGQDVARRLFKALDVAVEETPLDLANALDGASTGDIDAVVVVAPAPFVALDALGGAGMHLLPLPEGAVLPTGLVASEIAPTAYPGLTQASVIRTAAAPAVLSLSAKGAKDPAARRLLTALAENSESLSRQGFNLLRADAGATASARVARNEGSR